MGSIKILSSSDQVVISVFPFDRGLYTRFISLFPTMNVFASKEYQRVKLALSNVQTFVTDQNQNIPFDKFYESVEICRAYGFSKATSEQRHHFNTMYKRFQKLVRLITNNSVLFQHFGIEDIDFNKLSCGYKNLKEHRVCTVHVHPMSVRKDNLVAGHSRANSDLSSDCIDVSYTWDEYDQYRGRDEIAGLIEWGGF